MSVCLQFASAMSSSVDPGDMITQANAKPGVRVERGPDWKWGEQVRVLQDRLLRLLDMFNSLYPAQDGGCGKVGTIRALPENGMVSYKRMGCSSQHPAERAGSC